MNNYNYFGIIMHQVMYKGEIHMNGEKLQIFIAMCFYIAIVIGIGVYFYKRASASSGNYLIGGRSLGPWVTAMGPRLPT